jgi:K+-sensing histidine kinase KdpD
LNNFTFKQFFIGTFFCLNFPQSSTIFKFEHFLNFLIFFSNLTNKNKNRKKKENRKEKKEIEKQKKEKEKRNGKPNY